MRRIGEIMSENRNNPLNTLLEHPATYTLGSILVLVGVAAGWLDGWYALVLLGIAAYGFYTWIKKRKTSI